MATESMWKSIRSTFDLCPFSILKYDSHSNTVLWVNVRLSCLFYAYTMIGTINSVFLAVYIVYKILNTQMSAAMEAIHFALFSVVVYVWPLCLISIYTVIGNSGLCFYFYNLLSHFEQFTMRKLVNEFQIVTINNTSTNNL